MNAYQEELDRAVAGANGRGRRITEWLATRPDLAAEAPPPRAGGGDEEVTFVFPPYQGFLPEHIITGGGTNTGGGYIFTNGNGKVWAESPDNFGTSWGWAHLWVGFTPPLQIPTALSVRPLVSYEGTWSVDQRGITPAKVYGTISMDVRSYGYQGSDPRAETRGFQELIPEQVNSGQGEPDGYALQVTDVSIPSFTVDQQRQYAAFFQVAVLATGAWQGDEDDYARCDIAINFSVRWVVLGQRYQ